MGTGLGVGTGEGVGVGTGLGGIGPGPGIGGGEGGIWFTLASAATEDERTNAAKAVVAKRRSRSLGARDCTS